MARERYFIVAPDSDGDGIVVIGGAEFHHCVRVCRMRVGDALRALDGRGGVYEARIERIGSGEAFLRVLAFEKASEPPPVDMAIALVRAPRFDFAVEKCTELGVRRLVPLASERSVWRDEGDAASLKIERLRRKIIASCKQSGQPYFPEVDPVATIDALIGKFPAYRAVYVADRHADSFGRSVAATGGGPLLGVVGPEGGFSDGELRSLLAAGAAARSLGPFRLRTETAAFCLLYRLSVDLLAVSPSA